MTVKIHVDHASGEQPETPRRPLARAMSRAILGKCPRCGEGKLFRGYLKVTDECPVCQLDLSCHRADDAPPYITIVIVGHILVGLMLHLQMFWRIPPYAYLATLVPLAVILPLVLLPFIKGAIVGLQWANRMHGFDQDENADSPENL